MEIGALSVGKDLALNTALLGFERCRATRRLNGVVFGYLYGTAENSVIQASGLRSGSFRCSKECIFLGSIGSQVIHVIVAVKAGSSFLFAMSFTFKDSKKYDHDLRLSMASRPTSQQPVCGALALLTYQRFCC